MKIMIVELHPDYFYPVLIGKEITLQDDAPHTKTEYAFHKWVSKRGDVAWAYVHKSLCKIVKQK